MARLKPMKGKYSAARTARGNVQVGRVSKHKTNIQVARSLKSTGNLFAHTRKRKHFTAGERLALERAGR